MARPRIILHLGAPKTGSTYLQRRLAANRAALREAGVFWPVLDEVAAMAGNAKLLATALAGAPSLSFARAFPAIDVATLDPAVISGRLLADWRAGEEAAILSAENLRPSHAQTLRDILPVESDIYPILLIRRQDAWANSYFNQLTKTGDVAESVAAFVSRICEGTDERFCRPDWLEHRDAWQRAFGACEILFYDEVKGALFEAFMAAATLTNAAPIDIPPAQEAIDIYQLAYLADTPLPISDRDVLARREAAARVSARRGLTSRRDSILGPAELERLRARFGPSNRTLLTGLGRDADDPILAIAQSNPFCFADFVASADLTDFRREADAEACTHAAG